MQYRFLGQQCYADRESPLSTLFYPRSPTYAAMGQSIRRLPIVQLLRLAFLAEFAM